MQTKSATSKQSAPSDSAKGQASADSQAATEGQNTSNGKDSSSGEVKKSAGACINGSPVMIHIINHGKSTTIYPGHKLFKEIADAGERIILRTSGRDTLQPPVEGTHEKLLKESPYATCLVYNKKPTFTCFAEPNDVLKKVAPTETDLNTVAFFFPENFYEAEPGTVYDGFFYGDVKMVSTLTNYELVRLVKQVVPLIDWSKKK